MTEQQRIRMYHSSRTAGLIKDYSDENENILRTALNSHVGDYKRDVSGNRYLTDGCESLGQIDGFNIDTPSLNIDAQLGEMNDNSPSKSVFYEIGDPVLKSLEEIKLQTGLKFSTTSRMCIFKLLRNRIKMSSKYTRKEPQERDIDIINTEIKTEMPNIKSQFHSILHKYFVLSYDDSIKSLIKDDPNFETFAGIYKVHIYPSETYEILIDMFGHKTFNEVENIIEIHTDYTFQNKERFLEELE